MTRTFIRGIWPSNLYFNFVSDLMQFRCLHTILTLPINFTLLKIIVHLFHTDIMHQVYVLKFHYYMFHALVLLIFFENIVKGDTKYWITTHTTQLQQTSLRLINMYVLLVTFYVYVATICFSNDNDNNNINIMDGCMSCINKIILFKLGFGIDNIVIFFFSLSSVLLYMYDRIYIFSQFLCVL